VRRTKAERMVRAIVVGTCMLTVDVLMMVQGEGREVEVGVRTFVLVVAQEERCRRSLL